jgi:hypothetical protein
MISSWLTMLALEASDHRGQRAHQIEHAFKIDNKPEQSSDLDFRRKNGSRYAYARQERCRTNVRLLQKRSARMDAPALVFAIPSFLPFFWPTIFLQ